MVEELRKKETKRTTCLSKHACKRLQGQREHYRQKESGRRQRGWEEDKEEIKSSREDLGKKTKWWSCSLRKRVKKRRKKRTETHRETCWPLLNLQIKSSWTQDSHHMSDYHLCDCVYVWAVGWLDVCGRLGMRCFCVLRSMCRSFVDEFTVFRRNVVSGLKAGSANVITGSANANVLFFYYISVSAVLRCTHILLSCSSQPTHMVPYWQHSA